MARAKMAAAALGFVLMAAGLGLALRGVLATSTPQRTDLVPARAAGSAATAPDRSLRGPPAETRSEAIGERRFHHGSTVNQVLYTRDGRFLVTVDIKRVVSVWDAASGRLFHQIRLSGDLFDRIAVSPDGTTFATTEPNPDHPLRLWDVATGLERRRWQVKGSSQSPAFSPDGRTLMTDEGESDPTTKQWVNFLGMWDVTAPTERRRKLVGEFRGFQISPDGRTLIVIEPGTRKVPSTGVCTTSGTSPRVGNGPRSRSTGSISARLRFSPDGKLLLGALTDGTIRVYDPATGQERPPRLGPVPRDRRAGGRRGPAAAGRPIVMASMTFSPDGAILARPRRSTPACSLARATSTSGISPGVRAAPDPDSAGVAVAVVLARRQAAGRRGGLGADRPILGRGHRPRSRSPAGHVQGITALAVSPADSTIFTGSKDGMIRRWDPASGRELGLIAQLDDRGLELAVWRPMAGRSSPGAVGLENRCSGVWRRAGRSGASESPIASATRDSGPWVAYSPDGRTVASERTVWDVATGKALIVLRHRRAPSGHSRLEYLLVYIRWKTADRRRGGDRSHLGSRLGTRGATGHPD